MKLYCEGNKELILSNLLEAKSFWLRAKGLIGKKHLDKNEGLLFGYCNCIHTFFMKIPIDIIFLDKHLTIVAVYSHVKSFRIIGPVWRARSVIELSPGLVDHYRLKKGEKLYVGA